MSFRSFILADSINESDYLNKLKDAFYGGSYSLVVGLLNKISPEDEQKLSINAKNEIKIFNEILKLQDKSKLSIKL